jgi:hypothetical protein
VGAESKAEAEAAGNTRIEDTHTKRLVTEIEMLKVVLYLVFSLPQ